MSGYNPVSRGTDTGIDLDQTNELYDGDILKTSISVVNKHNVTQNVNVNGDEDGSDVNIIAKSGDGIDDINDALNVKDDLTITASASASASGKGYALAFNQTLATGANQQSNDVTASIVGGDADIAKAGENSAGFNTGNASPSGSANDTDTGLEEITQTNTMGDIDTINQPLVSNASGFHANAVQNVNVYGGSATSGDGIHNVRHSKNTGSSQGVGDDFSIDASTAAQADALGVARAFNQNIQTGLNSQGNAANIEIVGADVDTASAGEDGAAIDTSAGSPAPTGADTNTHSNITQSNTLNDHATSISTGGVYSPTVSNESHFNQDVYAKGGNSEAGNGFKTDGAISVYGNGVGSDSSVSGSAVASADAIAAAAGFTQNIVTGGNVQNNQAALDITGANKSAAVSGQENASINHSVATSNSQQYPPSSETDTDLLVHQTNTMKDADIVSGAAVYNWDDDVSQTVKAEGGTSKAGDGIQLYNGGRFGSSSVGDDSYVDGSTSATADANASALSFDQRLFSGNNTQSNNAKLDVTGASSSSAIAGESGANLTHNTADNTMSATGTITTVHDNTADQSNEIGDKDQISKAFVQNLDFSPKQTVTATGGEATSLNGIGHGDDAAPNNSATYSAGEVSDDEYISGSASASANASASADSFNQLIVTGNNRQTNSSDMSVVGGDKVVAQAGEDNASAQGMGVEGTNTNSNLSTDQANTAWDGDLVNFYDNIAPVKNGGNVSQKVIADGGTAEAGDGINSEFQVGGLDVKGDSSITGVTSASSDASAQANAFNHVVATAGNTQGNDASYSVIGGNSSTAEAGENEAYLGQLVDGKGGNVDWAGSDTTSSFHAHQNNKLGDEDTITNSSVLNEGFDGDAKITQEVTANGNKATAGDGIESTAARSLGQEAVGDDAVISGSASATADAKASASTMNQSLYTSANKQVNALDMAVVGSNSNTLAAGEDDSEANFMGGSTAAHPAIHGSTDTTIYADQGNLMFDSDFIASASLQNNGTVTQTVSATGGEAAASDGIQASDLDGAVTVTDNYDLSGSTSASANADASASAFNQVIAAGGNTQLNSAQAKIVGDNANTVSVGDDSSGNEGEMRTGIALGNADTVISFDQTNTLTDNDKLSDIKLSNSGHLTQNVNAEGGEAKSDDGIADDIGSTFSTGGSVGDDYTITAEALASAEATAKASAFNQNLYSGGNKQVNTSELSVTGQNDSFLFTGEDDSLDTNGASLAITPTGGAHNTLNLDENGTDSTFTIEQANSLYDQDMITNATIENTGHVTQNVDATGGFAQSDDGMFDAEGSMDFAAGDDYTIDSSTAATADALGVANAFNQTIVMGANVQANALNVSVVGGSSTVNVVGEDDLA